MRIILDTNVVLSGFFFGGVPGRILEAWRDGQVTLVPSAPILAEYREAGAEFEATYRASEFEAFAALLVVNSEFVDAPEHFSQPICSDPDDDKFLACAAASGTPAIVSGDRALLRANGWRGIEILTPREFADHYLS